MNNTRDKDIKNVGLKPNLQAAFSKIFDFVKNVWIPITQQKKSIKG